MTSIKHKLADRCWASAWTGGTDCKGGITQEHIVSRSILKYFHYIETRNNGEIFKFGKKSFVMPILCEYHNRALSSSDAEAFKFFSGWYGMLFKKHNHHIPEINIEGRQILDIDGHTLERWYAKTFFNFVLFRAKVMSPKLSLYGLSPHSIIPKLYQRESFQHPFGIYRLNKTNPSADNFFSFKPEFSEVTVIDKDGSNRQHEIPTYFYTRCGGVDLVGFFNLTAFEDEFALNSYLKPIQESLEKEAEYRHVEYGTDFHENNLNKKVKITWE